jgi:hypothetical protein
MAAAIRRLDISARDSVELSAAGSAGDIILAAAAVVLALIGIAGTAPEVAAGCTTVAIGVAFLFEGGAIGARFLHSIQENEEDSLTRGDVLGGLTADLVAGVAGIVLGALALMGVLPQPLLGTAVLVYGAALLLGCAALVHATVTMKSGVPEPSAGIDAALLAAGGQLVLGLVAFALGSLALLGTATQTLTLVALLLVAGAEIGSGFAIGSKMLRLLRAPA